MRFPVSDKPSALRFLMTFAICGTLRKQEPAMQPQPSSLAMVVTRGDEAATTAAVEPAAVVLTAGAAAAAAAAAATAMSGVAAHVRCALRPLGAAAGAGAGVGHRLWRDACSRQLPTKLGR